MQDEGFAVQCSHCVYFRIENKLFPVFSSFSQLKLDVNGEM